jgi:hypothetical protein
MAAPFTPRYTPDEYRQRPRDYDPEVADLVIRMLANGEMLPVICQDRDMPLPATFLTWVELDPELEKRYIAARRTSAEINLDMAVVIAGGRDQSIAGNASRALLTFVEKTHPARFGPRATITTKDGDEDGGIDYREEVRRRIDAISNKVGQKPDEPAKGA